MTVTDISEWKKGKYLIYLNDEPAFFLYVREVKDYNLKEGEELTPDKYEEILQNTLIKRAKSRTLHILDRYDKTEKELRDKLKADMYPSEAIDAAVEAAKSGKFLDDRRYAASYFESRSKRHSKKRIVADLTGKGISREILDDVIREASETEYENGEDPEEELILKLIRKKAGRAREFHAEEEAGIYRYLLGKGFEYGRIKKSLYKYLQEVNEML